MADMKKGKNVKGVNQWQEVLNILLHNPNAIIGFVIVAVLIVLAILLRGFLRIIIWR